MTRSRSLIFSAPLDGNFIYRMPMTASRNKIKSTAFGVAEDCRVNELKVQRNEYRTAPEIQSRDSVDRVTTTEPKSFPQGSPAGSPFPKARTMSLRVDFVAVAVAECRIRTVWTRRCPRRGTRDSRSTKGMKWMDRKILRNAVPRTSADSPS